MGRHAEEVMPTHFAGWVRDFETLSRKVVNVDGREIGIFRVDGSFYAYENICPHQGGPVCQGKILPRVEAVLGEDRILLGQRFSEQELHLVCPWHGWEFNITTGRCVPDPHWSLRTFDVRLEGGGVYLVL